MRSRIDKVLLVGGSSRMPQVAKMIQEDYNVTPVLQDPDEAVAKGAAIYAQNRSAYQTVVQEEAKRTGKTVEEIQLEGKLDVGGLHITNVLSCTYGIRCLDSVTDHPYISNILKVNTPLPAKETKMYGTVADGQEGVAIRLFETRSAEDELEIEDRQPLTVIDMKFKNRVPANTPLEVTMTLDNSGILHIHAVERYSNTELDTTFKLANQMSQDDMIQAGKRVAAASVE